MINDCPKCNKAFDFDGFWEHGIPTIYWCECGAFLREENMGLKIIPTSEVNIEGLSGNRNLYIDKPRWVNYASFDSSLEGENK